MIDTVFIQSKVVYIRTVSYCIIDVSILRLHFFLGLSTSCTFNMYKIYYMLSVILLYLTYSPIARTCMIMIHD